MDRKTVIFDIDGVLFDPSHRLYLLESSSPSRWDDFYRSARLDPPIKAMCSLANTLHVSGWDLLFMTGRRESIKEDTEKALFSQLGIGASFLGGRRAYMKDRLFMREDNDYRKDHDLKREMFFNLSSEKRESVSLIFEDRTTVVKMWRELIKEHEYSIVCNQTNDGDF